MVLRQLGSLVAFDQVLKSYKLYLNLFQDRYMHNLSLPDGKQGCKYDKCICKNSCSLLTTQMNLEGDTHGSFALPISWKQGFFLPPRKEAQSATPCFTKLLHVARRDFLPWELISELSLEHWPRRQQHFQLKTKLSICWLDSWTDSPPPPPKPSLSRWLPAP